MSRPIVVIEINYWDARAARLREEERAGKDQRINANDMPSSPFVFSFIGEANKLSVNINSGQIWLDEHVLDLAVSDMPSGPAQLFFRPHDVEVKKHLAGVIPAKVQGMRRHGGVRRLDLEVVGRSDRIEIDLPADFGIDLSEPIGVRPRRYRLYPAPDQSQRKEGACSSRASLDSEGAGMRT
jgi:ABC-type sulfate/molybdate transport systems ATPase subunit